MLAVFHPSILALTDLPPKEAGNWMDGVFNWCVEVLLVGAAKLGISYNAINVWIFCIVWPVFTLFLLGWIFYQRAQIRSLRRAALFRGGN